MGLTIGNRIGINGLVRQGTLLNLPEWAKTPYFALPSVINLISGQPITIYGDALINVAIINDLTVDYTCDIGTQSGTKDFSISPIDANIGNHTLTIKFKNKGNTFLTENITLSINAVAPAGSITAMMIGDSLVFIGHDDIATGVDSALTPIVTWVGRQGTTIKHEGIGGYAWSSFVTSADSPFVKGGVLNVPAYFTDNTIDIPDYVLFRLGVNDMFGWSNSDMTDSYMNAIVNRSIQLISAFLELNSTIKIFVGLTTICENTGAGWATDYDETVYLQNKYIELIHRFWIKLIATYDNSTYSDRVKLSNEAIFLDRNDGYPKTNGVHTNGVHPASLGYQQLGKGIAMQLNKEFTSILSPEISAQWVDDFARLTITDKSSGTAQHEIWESKNDGTYSLVTTLNAGVLSYDDYTWQNASMKFKVRAKSGLWLSNYSSEVTLATPLVFKTDQSTPTNVIFNYLHIVQGKTVNIDWGNGTNENVTGDNLNKTKTYTVAANPLYIKLSGDLDSIYQIVIKNQVKCYGDLSKWKLPSSIIYFELSLCSFDGSVNGYVLPSTVTYFNLRQSFDYGFVGDLSNIIIPPNLTQLLLSASSSSATKKLNGSASSLLIPATMFSFNINYNDVTALPRGEFVGIDNNVGFTALQNNCDTAEIDSFLTYLNDYFATHTPIKNAKYTINGTGMGVPSATGLAAKSGIEAKYAAAGFTATILVNT